MSRWLASIVFVVAMLAAIPQARANLYDDIGGQPGVERIVAAATARFLTDPLVGKTFEDTNMDRFKKMLADQICQLTGGPCEYRGHDMASAHRGLAVNQLMFNKLAEDLQDAMEDVGVSYHAQNRVLALLAPMQRDVVTR